MSSLEVGHLTHIMNKVGRLVCFIVECTAL
jgi:hypothetical protein